jgi:hypothetical protein
MALTTKTALSYYQQESADRTEWTNPINFSLEALSADDVEVCVINPQAAEGFQKLALIKDTDYTLNFATKTVTCTSTNWSDLSKINNHSATQIRVFRATSTTELVDFTNGAVLNADDLNLAYKQNLFATQEMNEDAGHTRGGIQSVSSNALSDDAVTTAKIQNNAVTSDKLAADAVITTKIANGAITQQKIAGEAVTSDELEADAVTTNKIEDLAVTTVKIEDEAVTYDKVKSASKTQMEGQLGTGTHGGETAGVVTPDVLKNSPLVPKCYGTVTFDTNTPTVSGDFNVGSVSRPDAYQRTITFDTALHDTSYTVLLTQQYNAASPARYPSVLNKSSNGFTLYGANGEYANMAMNFVVFGSTY